MRVDVAHGSVEPRLGLLHAQTHRCKLFLLGLGERQGRLLSISLHPGIQEGL